MADLFAGVHLLDAPYAIDHVYDYLIPSALADVVHSGSFVTVPFGRGNRKKLALVVRITDTCEYPQVKPLENVSIERCSLSPDQLSLCLYVAEQTLCTVGEAVRALLPLTALSRMEEVYRPATDRMQIPADPGHPEDEAVLSCIRTSLCVPTRKLQKIFGPGTEDILHRLRTRRLILRDAEFTDNDATSYLTLYRLAVPVRAARLLSGDAGVPDFPENTEKGRADDTSAEVCREGTVAARLTDGTVSLTADEKEFLPASSDPADTLSPGRAAAEQASPPPRTDRPLSQVRRLRSLKGRAVVRLLTEQTGGLTGKEICARVGCTEGVLDTLCRQGILLAERHRVVRRPYTAPDSPAAAHPITLNAEQQAAYDALCRLGDGKEPHAVLLHGVTGSGKTAVMLEWIAHLLADGRGAIGLRPEIALTPQSVSVFSSRFGNRVAVMHSGLSAGERYDAYEQIRRGECRVVIGTRSAVFAPVRDLGTIIIDEEQEHTYKSDQDPKYRAHDIARYRCAHEGALMLLASATPSLESYYKAREGKYTLLRLTGRYGEARLPRVTIADMREEPRSGNTSPLGTLLCRELTETLARGEQSVLFLNRRGYHKFLSCRQCGKAITCPHCSVAMTYHTVRGDYSRGELICHCCGTRCPVPEVCPECGSSHLGRMGYGTQRVEQELRELLPGAGILRMDTDTTSAKHAYDRMLGEFRSHRADVLLGTQMVTKGHDFPDVTLVGVLSADTSLYLDDYRAAERTFSLLTQVIGRAGRAALPGHAVIQTCNPESEVIRLACEQNYEAFYEREIALRRLLSFPPFCDIVLLTLSCEDEKELMLSTTRLYEQLRTLLECEYRDVPFQLFGPFEAPIYRAENRYRMRMVLKCRLNKRSRSLFSGILRGFTSPPHPQVTLSVDCNPSNL